MSRRILLVLVALVFAFTLAGAAGADEGDFTFDVGTGTITKYVGPVGDVVIPDKIGGVDVVKIGNDAFSICRSLTGYVLVVDTFMMYIQNS